MLIPTCEIAQKRSKEHNRICINMHIVSFSIIPMVSPISLLVVILATDSCCISHSSATLRQETAGEHAEGVPHVPRLGGLGASAGFAPQWLDLIMGDVTKPQSINLWNHKDVIDVMGFPQR